MRRRDSNDAPIFLGLGATSFAPQAHLQADVVCTKLKAGLADYVHFLQTITAASQQPGLTPAQQQQFQAAIATAQANLAQFQQVVASICGGGR